MGFCSVLFALLAVGFASESVGLYAHELNLALAITCLLLAAVVDPSTRRGDAAVDRKSLRLGIGSAAVGLLLLPSALPIRLFAMSLWFWGLDGVSRARGKSRGAGAALAVGCLLGGVYLYIYHSSLLSWYAVQGLSSQLTRVLSAVTGQPTIIGPTFNGLTLLVVVAGACVGEKVIASQRRLLPCIGALIGVVVAYAAYLCVFALAPLALPAAAGVDAETGGILSRIVQATYPLHLPLLAALLLSIPAGWYLGKSKPWGDRSITLGSWRRPALAAVPVVAAVLALTNMPADRRPGSLKVVMHEKGFLNWMVPTHERYGSRSAGMFGNLPLLVERMGWQSAVVPDFTPETMAGADILVIMNQKEPLPAETLKDIDRFVRGGGSLLVLGDHTWRHGGTTLLCNQPIGEEGANTDIRYRFDSAYYFIGGWLHSLQYGPHQIVGGLGDAVNEPGCVVGASLEIAYPAAPLIVGRYGFSDPGVETAKRQGYMGNSLYDPGEPLGDLVLAAAQNVGRGRVIVVGDTSGFVNMIQSQTWPFTMRVFNWLGSTGRAAIPAWRDVIGLLLLAFAAIAVLVGSRRATIGLPLSCLVLWGAGTASRAAVASINPPDPLRGNVAFVDLSHVGEHSVEGWRPNGIAGVYANLMRKGYFTIGSLHFDERQIQASDLFVSIVPTQPYTGSEVDFLEDYMTSGGTVLLAAGWEEKAGIEAILSRFDLEIMPKPEGRASVNVFGTALTPQFWRSWQIVGGEPLVSLRGDPVIVRKAVGRGQLILIGDGGFLFNQNLETEDGGILPNIQFFDWLLDRVAERGAT